MKLEGKIAIITGGNAGVGVGLLPEFPMDTPHGRIAFLNPDHTGAILIELREEEQQ